jgi:hypothetical protein
MIVSRAFADFARWQVPVGWGADKDVDVSGLRTAGRSKARSGCQRHRAAAAFHRQRQSTRRRGRRALARQVRYRRCRGIAGNGGQRRRIALRDARHGLLAPPDQAMRGAQDGFAGTLEAGVAESFRAAQRSAADDFQHALSLLKESLAWRRSDRLDKQPRGVATLPASGRRGGVNAALPTFAAMVHVVRAWEHYARAT